MKNNHNSLMMASEGDLATQPRFFNGTRNLEGGSPIKNNTQGML